MCKLKRLKFANYIQHTTIFFKYFNAFGIYEKNMRNMYFVTSDCTIPHLCITISVRQSHDRCETNESIANIKHTQNVSMKKGFYLI